MASSRVETGVVELPLILLLAAGLGTFVESKGVRAGIGLVGGLLLLAMGLQLLLSLGKPDASSTSSVQRHPLWIGIVLSGANPISSCGGRRSA